jgi:micrococcal nuclease
VISGNRWLFHAVRVCVALSALVLLVAGCGSAVGSPGQLVTPAALASGRPTVTTKPGATPRPVASNAAEPSFVLAPAGPTESARVVRVVDGDTIVVDRGRGNEKVRYIGMNTPETVKPNTPVEFMGKEASAANSAMVTGRTVTLEKDVSETDQYGRLLRYVWVGDGPGSAMSMVNLALVQQGFAQADTWPPDVRYADVFVAAQVVARERGLGLWGPAAPSLVTAPPSGLVVVPDVATKPRKGCDQSYPDVCIPPAPPDLDCGDIPFRNFKVLPPDPHRFDGNHDGIGCTE